MANPWFKFYAGDYLSDPKIMLLNANERSCWITLLCQACQNEGKPIKFLSEVQLLIMSGVLENIKVLEKFQDLGLVTLGNDSVTVKNWEKRQLTEGALRVRNFRKRNGNKMITIEENRVDKIRIEKKKEEMIPLPSWINLRAFDAWCQYRKERKKKLTPTTLRLQLKFLEEHQKDHVQIIKNSITNGWTGLFPLKEHEKRMPKKYEEPDNSKEMNERRNFLDSQSKLLTNKFQIK